MEKLVIGSQAMVFWFPEWNHKPKDVDYISKTKVYPITKTKSATALSVHPRIETHWVDSFQYILDNNKDKNFIDPDFLYTLKVSHAAWDIKWDKTIAHIVFLKEKGCKLDKTLYDLLIKEWGNSSVHREKQVNLNMTTEEFFTDAVYRKYNHDWLHEQLAFKDVPWYTKLLIDNVRPMCSKKEWYKLNHEEKIQCVLEEIYVTATERFIVPSGFDYSPKKAKYKSTKKLIVSMSKGWFNLFTIENFKEIMDYDDSHWLTCLNKLKEKENGTI